MSFYGFQDTGNYPRRVVLTDDPLRAKMLAAHHLEETALMYEKDDELVYFGSYGGVPLALVAAGFEDGALQTFLRSAKDLGVGEVIYMGACAATDERRAPGTVVLAEGCSSALLERVQAAAEQCGVFVITAAIRPRVGAETESGPGGIFDGVTAELYDIATAEGVEALAVLTIAENVKTGESMEEHERRSRFYAAAKLIFSFLEEESTNIRNDIIKEGNGL
jgi:purine-nucleoside phosphorylase